MKAFKYIKDIFKFGLIEDYIFARVLFIFMQLTLIWGICGLIFVSKCNEDIILNCLQIVLYVIFMISICSRKYLIDSDKKYKDKLDLYRF